MHAQYVIRFHNVIERVATMEDSNGSGRMFEWKSAITWVGHQINLELGSQSLKSFASCSKHLEAGTGGMCVM